MNSPVKPIRVLLVDDHRSYLWGINKLLEGEGSKMLVVGQAHNRAEALGLARQQRPDVILLDLDLGKENGLDFLPELLRGSSARALILTGTTDSRTHDRAIKLGASGILHKEETAEIVLKAIEKVHGGELWLDRGATARVFAEIARGNHQPEDSDEARINSLTPKEREVILKIVTEGGASNKQIADRLNMSVKTLSNHLTAIYHKLGVENRLGLFMYAIKHGLDQPQS